VPSRQILFGENPIIWHSENEVEKSGLLFGKTQ